MAFLLDTNVLSELRKKRRNEPKVQGWLDSVDSEDLFTSVIVVGEIRRGIEKIRPTDPVFASQLELWLRRLQLDYQDRILSITEEIAEFWGTICPNDPLPEPDGANRGNCTPSRNDAGHQKRSACTKKRSKTAESMGKFLTDFARFFSPWLALGLEGRVWR